MNKKIINGLLFSALLCFPMCFTSCGDDEEEENNGGQNGKQEEPKQEEQDVVFVKDGTLINGKFSVSESKQVYFSQGNLWKTGDSYAFAADQMDCVRENNLSQETKDLIQWMDVTGMELENNTWRCLSSDEWNYLVLNRPNASKMCMFAQVKKNGKTQRGTIIFPDDFTFDGDNSYRMGLKFSWTEMDNVYNANNIDEKTWKSYEAQGALFLPHAGSCSGYDADSWYMYYNESASYWCSNDGGSISYTAGFGEYNYSECKWQTAKSYCRSYRLVRDVE